MLQTYKSAALPIGVSVIVIGIGVYLLALSIWPHGAKPIPSDSAFYMQAALNLWNGAGLVLLRYDAAADMILSFPLTHYPPAVPGIYALGMALGLPLASAPSAVALISWGLLLAGIGVLTLRLSGSYIAGATAVLVAALTYSFWLVFQWVMSEVMFLPLLVWLMVALVDLPQQQRTHWLHYVVAVLLLALLPLTRYTGVLVLAAVALWWGWHWWQSRRTYTVFVRAGFMVSIAALPIAMWLLYNHLYVDVPLGSHSRDSAFSLLDGLTALAIESGQLLLPSVHPDWLYAHVGAASWVVYIPIAVGVVFLAWRYWPADQLWHQPPRTPLLVFLLIYVLFYTLVQPFMQFWPIDARDMTSVLCLTIPWGIGMIARYVPSRQAILLLLVYVLINGLVAFGPTAYKAARNGFPEWVHLSPPRLESLADRNLSPDWSGFSSGFLSWLTVVPPRTANLANHHPNLLEYVRTLPPDTVLITNGPLLLVPYSRGPVEDIREPYPQAGIPGTIQGWLDAGACTAPEHPIAIVIFDWDYLSQDADEISQRLLTKCPDLAATTFRHSTMYMLPEHDS